LDLFTKPEWLEKAKKEHKERIGDRVYKSAIPDNVNPPLEIAEAAWQKLKGKQ